MHTFNSGRSTSLPYRLSYDSVPGERLTPADSFQQLQCSSTWTEANRVNVYEERTGWEIFPFFLAVFVEVKPETSRDMFFTKFIDHTFIQHTYLFFRAIAWNCVNYSKTCIYIQVRTMTCNCTQLHKKKRARNDTQLHKFIRTYIPPYIHTCLHTYIPDTLKYSGSRMLGPGDQPSKGLLWWRLSF